MLEKIRRIGHNSLFKIFFFFLAFIFAISLGNFNNSSNSDVIATIGKEKISLNDFSNARRFALKQLSEQQYLTPEQAQFEADNLSRNILNKMISQKLISLELNSLGIRIPDELIAEYIQKDETFHKNGRFNPELYREALANNNINEETLIKSISTELASKFLIDSFIANSPIKNTLSSYLYDYLTEKRSISLISVDSSKINYSKFPGEQIKEFYNAHPELFQSKEYRSFSYVIFDVKNLKEAQNISNSDLLNEYETNKEEYALPETRDFHHFLTPSEEIANQIVQDLKSNPNHLEVSNQFIDKNVISEKFINQNQQDFLSSLDPNLFKVSIDSITSPVKSDLGWHVFKITKIHPKQYKSFEESKEKVMQNLLNKIAQTHLYEVVRQVEDDLSSGANLKEIAIRYNLIYEEVKDIALDGTALNNKTLKVNPQIIQTAFLLNLNQESQVTQLETSSNLFLVKLDSIIAPKLEEFNNIIDKAKSLMLKELKIKLASELAKDLQKEASKNPESLIVSQNNQLNNSFVQNITDKLLQKYKLSKKYAPIVTLENREIKRPIFFYDKTLPVNFINSLYSLELNKFSLVQADEKDNFIFAKINNIFLDDERNEDIYNQVKLISEENYKNELYNQYVDHLKNKYNVKINTKFLNENS